MITRALVIINVLAFLWEVSVAGPSSISLMGGGDGMLRVYQLGALEKTSVLVDHEYWRILTSAFLHGGLVHLFVNMVSLWSLGRFIEYAAGSARMFVIYFVSLVASGIGVVLLTQPGLPTLGASGAIFGLFGALFAIGFKLGKPGMQLVRDNLGILIINLIFTFTVQGISWQGHTSGLIAGFLLTLAIYFPPRRVAPAVVDASTGENLETEYQAPPSHQ